VTVLAQHVIIGEALINQGVLLAFRNRFPFLFVNVSKADVFDAFFSERAKLAFAPVSRSTAWAALYSQSACSISFGAIRLRATTAPRKLYRCADYLGLSWLLNRGRRKRTLLNEPRPCQDCPRAPRSWAERFFHRLIHCSLPLNSRFGAAKFDNGSTQC